MLILPIMPALHMFSKSLTAYETTSGYDSNNRWVDNVVGADFNFSGSFQPLTEKELKLLPAGDISNGAFVLWTTLELKFTDTSQTFLKETGEIWRIISLMDWNQHTGVKKYICRKYVDIS